MNKLEKENEELKKKLSKVGGNDKGHHPGQKVFVG